MCVNVRQKGIHIILHRTASCLCWCEVKSPQHHKGLCHVIGQSVAQHNRLHNVPPEVLQGVYVCLSHCTITKGATSNCVCVVEHVDFSHLKSYKRYAELNSNLTGGITTPSYYFNSIINKYLCIFIIVYYY